MWNGSHFSPRKPLYFVLAFVIFTLFVSYNRAGWDDGLATVPLSSNSIWLVHIPQFSVTNATLMQACRELERASKSAANQRDGISISEVGVSKSQKTATLSFHRQQCTLLDVLMTIAQETGTNFRIIDHLAILGTTEYRVLPVSFVVQCIDAANGKPVSDVEITCRSPGIFPCFQLPIVSNDKEAILWHAQLIVPYIVADNSTSILDAQVWNQEIELTIKAPRFTDQTIKTSIFGNASKTPYLQIKLGAEGIGVKLRK